MTTQIRKVLTKAPLSDEEYDPADTLIKTYQAMLDYIDPKIAQSIDSLVAKIIEIRSIQAIEKVRF